MKNKLISVILTGGKSSRMNYLNKSFLKISDQFFIEKIINSLKEKTEIVCINANNDIDFERDYLLIESTNIINDYLNLNKKLLISKVE